MILFKTTSPLQRALETLRSKGKKIGFVPTMGALHDGHLSLIKYCKSQCDIVVCSIFVNPTQFNNKEDFEKYPITIENDIYLLETNNTDVLFLPSVDEVYTGGTQQLHQFKLGYLEEILEGKYRPGHFQGVCNVVCRLLNIVKPDKIFLGRKDYQQYLVLKKMMEEFFPAIQTEPVNIAREANGLAMSSRNMRLSNEARDTAAALYQSLQCIKENIFKKDIKALQAEAAANLIERGFDKVDYVEVCDADTLLPVTSTDDATHLIVLAAAFIENVRLIDNILL